jgi:hypothetical protein
MMSGRSEGGLGIETPMMHAHKCKLRIVLKGLNKGGLTAVHLENLLRIELEKSGKGGLPNQSVTMHVTWGTTGYITSLLEWLDEVNLAIHLPGLIYNSPYALWIKLLNPKKRMKSNDRSIFKLSSEMDTKANEGGPAAVRAGQFWEVEGGLLEITSTLDSKIEGRRWDSRGKKQAVGTEVVLRKGDRHGGGSSWSIPLEDMGGLKRLAVVESTPLKLRETTRKITKLMKRVPILIKPERPMYAGDALQFSGFEYDTIYTDGSWKESLTLRDVLSGKRTVKAGGAVILGKGDRYLCIHVAIDIETESAFEVEMISLLIAIDIAGTRDVTIYSDCKSALSLLNGRNRGAFFNILSGWKKPVDTILKKVKAHPEKFKKPEDWGDSDKGIWIADQIAGKAMKASKSINAAMWLKRISYTSKAVIVEQGGIPFVKDISKRWSKHLMERYLKERDDYREAEGKSRKWEGANLRLSYKMMGKEQKYIRCSCCTEGFTEQDVEVALG